MELKELSADKLNNTKNADIPIIYYMRVPKSGSQALMYFINKYLSKINDFDTLNQPSSDFENEIWPLKRQLKTAKKIIQFKDSFVFNGLHESFINFKLLNLTQPIYISLIKDPVDKVISWFYYKRSELYNSEKVKDLAKITTAEEMEKFYNKDFTKCVLSGDRECQFIPYTLSDNGYRKQSKQFCGNYKPCVVFNSPKAIQMAKLNVEKNFAVVGSWEDANITLTVLEQYIPRYFKGAKEIFYINYERIRNHNRNKKKPEISETIKDLIRKNFTNEIEFYQFCKQRLYKQYLAIKLKNLT